MPFKSSLVRSAVKLLKVFKERDISLRGATQTSRCTNFPFSASGGTKTTYSTYTVHTFLTTSPFEVAHAPPSFACDILVVGGGGAGGSGEYGAYEAGGGGAGGMRAFPNQPVDNGSYTATVGDGGAAVAPGYAQGYGEYSELSLPSPLRSEGGGVGGQGDIAGSGFGGSGGGCRRGGSPGGKDRVAGTPSPSPSPVPAQGNNGGAGYSAGASSGGGGGGGAGGAGGGGGSNSGGAGGAGLQNAYRTGSNVYYAGGGGGVGFNGNGGAGGSSIGGTGGDSGGAGTTNTGSGGGAGDNNGPTNNGGDGGPGIIVIRYTTPQIRRSLKIEQCLQILLDTTCTGGLDKLKILLYNDTEYIIGIWHSKLHGI